MNSLNLMNKLGDKLSLPMKIALFSLVLTLIGVVGVAFFAYNYADDVLQKNALQSLAQKVDREAIVLTRVLKTIQQDVTFLVESPPASGISRALDNEGYDDQQNMTLDMWKESLSTLFKTVLTQRNMYYQLRLIGLNDHGREIIRVARSGGLVEVISEHELQQKERRDYFQEGIKLAPGKIYISNISLNREHGEITFPPRPMLRVVTPLYDHDGDLFAILVINAGLKAIASGMHNAVDGLFFFMANDKGDYLVHPDEKRAMAFEYERRGNILDDYPMLSETMTRMAGVSSRNEAKQSEAFNLTGKGVGLSLYHFHFDPERPERFLVVGAVEKLSSLREESLDLRNKLLFIVFVLALSLALATFLVVRHVTRPILHLKRAADRVAAGEDNVDIPIFGHDEIASLGESFRDMLSNLSASKSELRKSNVDLEVQVSQRTHELESAKHNLETQNVELAHALEQ